MSIILPNSMSSLSFIFVFFLFARRPPLNRFSLFRSGIYSKSNYIAYFLLFPTLHTIQFTKQKLMWTERERECAVFGFGHTHYTVCHELMRLWRLCHFEEKRIVWMCACEKEWIEKKKIVKKPLFALCSVLDLFFFFGLQCWLIFFR